MIVRTTVPLTLHTNWSVSGLPLGGVGGTALAVIAWPPVAPTLFGANATETVAEPTTRATAFGVE